MRKERKKERGKKDMQETSHKPPERSHDDTWLTILLCCIGYYRGIRVSIGIALVLIAFDAVYGGTYLLSYIDLPSLVLFSIVNNATNALVGNSRFSGLPCLP